MEVKRLTKKKKVTMLEFKKFLKEFEDYKNECNKKHSYKEANKYYLVIINNTLGIEIENKDFDAFVLLGYFNSLNDCQKAREKFENRIIEFNDYGYWD